MFSYEFYILCLKNYKQTFFFCRSLLSIVEMV